MGTPTGNFTRITRSTGRSSDYFGLCEVCKKHMSEAFRSRIAREWVRDNGELYYGHESPAVYAHENCLKHIEQQAA